MDSPRSMMDTPRSYAPDLTKKTRATSCTNCRQVKLKCDLKERYPNPCSRCTAQHSECKTDSSFKRVPVRSRIKDLEAQVHRLKRDRALTEASTPRPAEELNPELPYRTLSYSHLDEPYASHAASDRVSYGSPSGSEISRSDVKWLNIPESGPPQHFTLGDFALPYPDAYDLYSHFEDQYHRHFCILEPIYSLNQLQTDSQFLFWSIVLVSSRNHIHHSHYFESVQTRISHIYVKVTEQEIQSLLDLQAFLLLCTFNLGRSRDFGWLQIGMAVNAARQMGLDKDKDEFMVGPGPGQTSVSHYPRHVRQMTWMKCFELDVQSSCWQGLLPNLGYPHHARIVGKFCDSSSTNFSYAAIVSIHVELAQSLLALDEGVTGGREGPSFLIRMFNERFNALKIRWSPVWSLEAEIELLTARLYLHGTCLTSLEASGMHRHGDGFFVEVLQTCHTTAVQLATLLTNVHAESTANLQSLGFASSSWPLPGRPKHHHRSAEFAASVLLKYLDDPQGTADDEAARNAYVKVYQMFAACPESTSGEHQETARTLEAAGRAIGTGQGQMQSHVTTRMAASMMFNVRWLASQLKTKGRNPEVRIDGADFLFDNTQKVLPPTTTPPNCGIYGNFDQIYAATTCGPPSTANIIFSDLVWEPAHTMPNVTLGFETWDNTAFDSWQPTMPYPASSFEAMPMAYTRA